MPAKCRETTARRPGRRAPRARRRARPPQPVRQRSSRTASRCSSALSRGISWEAMRSSSWAQTALRQESVASHGDHQHLVTISPWPPDASALILRTHRPPPKEHMLRFARALGFLAPLAVTLCASVVLVLTSGGDAPGRSWVLSAVFLAALAGMTTTALAAWSYMGWRLNRLARVLEATLTEDAPVVVKEAGIPAERRLARAFNAAAGAFFSFEARATHDRLTGVVPPAITSHSRWRSSTSIASSRSTTRTATTAGTPCCAKSPTSSSTTSGLQTSSVATAARSSC